MFVHLSTWRHHPIKREWKRDIHPRGLSAEFTLGQGRLVINCTRFGQSNVFTAVSTTSSTPPTHTAAAPANINDDDDDDDGSSSSSSTYEENGYYICIMLPTLILVSPHSPVITNASQIMQLFLLITVNCCRASTAGWEVCNSRIPWVNSRLGVTEIRGFIIRVAWLRTVLCDGVKWRVIYGTPYTTFAISRMHFY